MILMKVLQIRVVFDLLQASLCNALCYCAVHAMLLFRNVSRTPSKIQDGDFLQK